MHAYWSVVSCKPEECSGEESFLGVVSRVEMLRYALHDRVSYSLNGCSYYTLI